MDFYRARLEKVWDWMKREGLALVMFEDFEGKRDSTIRWLTGQPGDSLLFLSAERKSLLVPWDLIMAQNYAKADEVLPYNDLERSPVKAILAAAERFGLASGARIELPAVTPYPVFLRFREEIAGFELVCREKSGTEHAMNMRAVKDEQEIGIYREAAAITSDIADLIEAKVRSGEIRTEADAAMLIEVEAGKRGCEGTSFETLSAGPKRSFGIHAFPSRTSGPFATDGLSILDFGVRYRGYCTDITMTFARALNREQEIMLGLVEEAAAEVSRIIAPGTSTTEMTGLVEGLFAKAGRKMEHGLGHGVGLDVHEFPSMRSLGGPGWKLEPGMVVAVEPGLYDSAHGGCRLENDFLVTKAGHEVLTRSRVVRL